MNYRAILHIQNSQYCYAVNDNTVGLMLRTSSEDKFEKITLIYGNKYDYYFVQKREELAKSFSDGSFDYYTLMLPLDDVRLVYVFELQYKEKIYYFSEDGLSDKYDFSLAFYNSFQFPYINRADVLREVEWMKNARFYEIFTDRFNRGNKDKDDSYINLKWGDIPTPKSFAGGDLQGIIDKLDYLASLGINAIYLTPIFKSISNHKYDISDYYEIDEHFGDKATFKRLVDAAHSKGIKIVLDAVFNHCSEKFERFQDVVIRGKKSPYHDWFIINGDKPNSDNYECFGVCKYMPKFNTSNPEVQKYLLEIATYWIKEFDIDGWRLDVSDEVSHDFWRAFRKVVKETKKDCIILGENWHDSADFLRGDQFDGIMNYSFTKACLDYFAFNVFEAEDLTYRLSEILMRNTDTVNYMMLNLLDSHDTHRFYSEVAEDDFSLEAALCLTYMFPGAPCIYYGTEIRMQGGYDPDCRRCMDWNKTDDKMRELLKKLAELRTVYGIAEGTIEISSEKDDFILIRKTNVHEFELRINKKKKNYEILMDGGIYL